MKGRRLKGWAFHLFEIFQPDRHREWQDPILGSELHQESGAEGLLRRPHAGDSIRAVPPELPTVVHHKQEEVAVLGPAQRVWLDSARAPSAVLGPVIDIDLQSIGSRIPDQFEREPPPPRRDRSRCHPCGVQIGPLDPLRNYKCNFAREPPEYLIQRRPEVSEGGQWLRELVTEHVPPLALDLLAVRRGADRLGGGHVDAGVGALPDAGACAPRRRGPGAGTVR